MNLSMNPQFVVTGATGQLGQQICSQAKERTTALGRSELDITDPDSVEKMFKTYQPGVVVNCAAYTAVDKAETDTATCELVNVTGPRYLADYASRMNCKLVHVSTDYVFHDRRSPSRPWRETDPVSHRLASTPKRNMGASKRC